MSPLRLLSWKLLFCGLMFSVSWCPCLVSQSCLSSRPCSAKGLVQSQGWKKEPALVQVMWAKEGQTSLVTNPGCWGKWQFFEAASISNITDVCNPDPEVTANHLLKSSCTFFCNLEAKKKKMCEPPQHISLSFYWTHQCTQCARSVGRTVHSEVVNFVLSFKSTFTSHNRNIWVEIFDENHKRPKDKFEALQIRMYKRGCQANPGLKRVMTNT